MAEVEVMVEGAYAAAFAVPSRTGAAAVLDLCLLSEEEHARRQSFLHEEDQIRYAFAHVMLRCLIGDRLEASPGSL